MTEMLLKFTALGADWVLWLLLGLSVINITIIVERLIFFRLRRIDVDELSESLSIALANKDIDAAKELVADSPAIECRVVDAGLHAFRRGLHGISEAMHSTKARERLKYEALTPVLGTLGNNSPFIGLLGTVIGIIQASAQLQAAQAAKSPAAAAVMGGVFEALVATAVGLLVALPAVVAFNIFQRKSASAMLRTDVLAHLLISYVKPSTGSSAHESRPTESTPPPVVAKGI